jgi:hypothetical protein
VSRARPPIPATVLALLVVVVAVTVEAQDSRPLRKIVVTLPFEEAELIVKSEAQRQNLNLVNVLDIQKGMENRGQTFRPYRIYQFCNLEMGCACSRLARLAHSPAAFIYEVDARQTALVSARQAGAQTFGPAGPATAAARQFERIIDEIFGRDRGEQGEQVRKGITMVLVS